MRRRDFLKNAGAAIVPAALPAALWGSASPALKDESTRVGAGAVVREYIPITAVIYDERYADCRAFAEALERHGAKAFATNQDAVQLWYGPLRTHLEKNPGRVAGLATYADFSSSVSCGRELAYVIRFEAHHDARRQHAIVSHHFQIHAGDREIAAAISTENWASQLAEALSRFAAPPFISKVEVARFATATSPRSSDHPGCLSSWLLAAS